ncbi:MAG TPA: hypothetical protein VGM88_27410 [Kofleriaceae bacterium]|jgi:hypothetical protein
MRLLLSSVALAACAHKLPPASCPQDVVLAGQDDVAAFASCREARSVTIRSGARLDTMPLHVERVQTLSIGPTVAIEQLTFPALREVGELRAVSNTSLARLALPALERAGSVTIEANVSLTTLVMPRLASCGPFAVRDSAELELIDVGSLATVGALALERDAKLADVESAALRQAASVTLADLPSLPAETADKLRAAVPPQ